MLPIQSCFYFQRKIILWEGNMTGGGVCAMQQYALKIFQSKAGKALKRRLKNPLYLHDLVLTFTTKRIKIPSVADELENALSQEEQRQEERLFFEDYWKALSIEKQKQLFNSSGIYQLLKETEELFKDNEFFQSIFITLKTDFDLMSEITRSDKREKTEDLQQRDLLSTKNFKKIKRLI